MSFLKFARIAFPVLAIALGGCSWVPASGPYAHQVRMNADATAPDTSSKLPYAVVKLTPETVSALARFEPRGLSGVFPDKYVPPAKIKFGVGDVVSVTIFEAAAGGLFIPTEAGVRPGNFVTIPDQTVDNDGNISIPYAGLVRAAGRYNGEIQQDIVNRIKNRAIEPQVVVSLSQQRTSLISVFGEVNTPNRFPAAAYGAQDRVTDDGEERHRRVDPGAARAACHDTARKRRRHGDAPGEPRRRHGDLGRHRRPRRKRRDRRHLSSRDATAADAPRDRRLDDANVSRYDAASLGVDRRGSELVEQRRGQRQEARALQGEPGREAPLAPESARAERTPFWGVPAPSRGRR
jgi:hypothetical protein